MKIIGIEGLTPEALQFEVQRGAKFVIYDYCISIVVMSFKRSSPIYFRKFDDTSNPGLKYSLISLLAGWWGIPFGLLWTITTLISNLRGGRNVTAQILPLLKLQSPQPPAWH